MKLYIVNFFNSLNVENIKNYHIFPGGDFTLYHIKSLNNNGFVYYGNSAIININHNFSEARFKMKNIIAIAEYIKQSEREKKINELI